MFGGCHSAVEADKAYSKLHKGVKKGQTIYTGRAPKAILDLKAAIRYLRHFDKQMPGDAERIITDGTSAGGAMSALMGATGNNPGYAELLKAMGAADERDRDTAFPVPINFATKLQNAGKDVNFLLAWNRPHSGDYALDELFQWIAAIIN